MYLSDSDLYLSCLSGTYRNGAHSGSLRFVVSFLYSREREEETRDLFGFCEGEICDDPR